MKQTILLMTMMAMLAACGGGQDTSDLGKKRAERDSLKTAYEELGKQIKSIEDWLAENDTTVKRNLPTVKTMDLQVGTYAHYVDVHGSVRADKAATLTAMGGGRVRKVNVQVGDQVRQGQRLVTLDNDMAQEQLDQAEAARELARTAFEKQERLWQQKIGSEMQYLQAKSQKEQAEAAVKTLEEQWRLSNIDAPFSGIVDEVMLREGDMAAPGLPVIRIVDLTGAQLEADVPESYLSRIKKGAPVLVVFPSIEDTVKNAQLDHVGDYIDPANRTFKVTVRMPNNENNIRPNLLSDISIRDTKADSAI
ncbi:MAG TPA: efflux RND transporter periplasmic adaptor subunit, partial [Flavobacteriales bacterium]|nr:efflux RND transporter periplasmic adaptor subunit [Flavobacteriales bacterium]